MDKFERLECEKEGSQAVRFARNEGYESGTGQSVTDSAKFLKCIDTSRLLKWYGVM